MASSYDRVANTTDSFTTGTLTGVVAGADHGNKADALNKIEAQVVKEAPLNVNWPGYGGNIATAITALPSTGASLYIPAGQYTGAFDFASKSHLTVMGDGSNSVIHNTTASDHALSFTDCLNVIVKDLRVQGTSGTFDGLHMERCHRAFVDRVYCQGSGRNGVYAEECIGIKVNAYVGIDVTSPFPTGVTNCTGGLKLTWDTVNADSGCNQFVIDGGWYVIGKDRGWAIEVDHGEGGVINGPVPELSKGGIKLATCDNVVVDGYYGEANPSDVEYSTGTVATTNADATVTGTTTAWNTNDGEGNKNAMVGKFFVIGTTYGRVLSITNDTSIELEANWANTASGQAYTLISGDLYMENCTGCVVSGGRGGAAVLLKNSSRNVLNLATERIFFDSTSNRNTGRIVTNRASATTSPPRLVDNGAGNRIFQFNHQTGADVRVDGLVRVSATELRTVDNLQSEEAVYSSVGEANQIALGGDGKIYFGSGLDATLNRIQAAVVGVGSSLNFPTAVTAASVPNNTIFRDSADNVIKIKDNGGTTRLLY